MTAKKKTFKLESNLPFSEELLFLISSTNKDYRLAYFLNKYLGLSLEKRGNLKYSLPGAGYSGSYSLYMFEQNEIELTWYLVSNKHEAGNLIKGFGKIDYILIVKGNYEQMDVENLLHSIRKIPDILFVQQTNHENLKNIYDVLEMIEISVMEENKSGRK